MSNISFNKSSLLFSLQSSQQNDFKQIYLLFTALYFIIFTTGFISNFLVIYFVLVYKRMQTMTNKFLTNLALADLLVILICIPVTITRSYSSHEYILGEFLCKFSTFIQGVSLSVSILTLTVISIDRYYIIHKPLKARSVCTTSKIKVTVSIIWALSIFIMSPFLIVFKLHNPLKQHGLEINICIEEWPHFEVKLAYETLLFIILFVVPLVFITYAYVTISRVLWNVEEKLIIESVYNNNNYSQLNQTKKIINRSFNSITSSLQNDQKKKIISFNSCGNIRFSEGVEVNKIFDNQPAGTLSSLIGSARNTVKVSSSSKKMTLQFLNTKKCQQQQLEAFLKASHSSLSAASLNKISSATTSHDNAICKLIRSRRRIVKLLIILVFLFVVSWLPYHVISLSIDFFHYFEVLKNNNSVSSSDVLYSSKGKIFFVLSEYVHPITLCLALANSATNPVCYCILSHNFRKMFKINFLRFKKIVLRRNKRDGV
jgi:hypothetical protein